MCRGHLDWLQAGPDVESPPARSWRDWALALLVLGTAVAEVLHRSDMVWRPVAPVVGLVLAIPTLWAKVATARHGGARFRHPHGGGRGLTVTEDAPFEPFAGISVLVLVYALFQCGTGREATIGSVIVLAEWGVAFTTDMTGATDAIGGLVVLLLAAALGVAVRYRRIVRRQQFERVRFHERDLLARELHDTVAHHVAAIAIKAQAGQVVARSGAPGGAAEALAVIDDEASRTSTEMRSVVRTLRHDDETTMPVPRGDGDVASSGPGPSGYGLAGMQERVTLLGETLEAGPDPHHGWTVRATISRSGRPE